MIVFDVSVGRHEADGVVQRIPGWGQKVEPVVADNLVGASWPKFLHPYALSDKYFLAAVQPSRGSRIARRFSSVSLKPRLLHLAISTV